ncbi:MAG: hypothetical protein LBI57_07985 [Helicobacteraceae bacterium]|jgi:lipopolysaccharide transport protein LptA|nr:hypothetical protein [Helicobacteraceae bacterium]
MIIRVCSLLAAFAVFLCAEVVEATAKSFYADENAGETILSGSAKIVRGKDVLRGDRITILFTKERDIRKYESKGASSFNVTIDENSQYIGEADEIVYLPSEGTYSLKGRAWVEDPINQRKVMGDQIVFNEKTRVAQVNGEQSAPVKLIFTIKDRNETKP